MASEECMNFCRNEGLRVLIFGRRRTWVYEARLLVGLAVIPLSLSETHNVDSVSELVERAGFLCTYLVATLVPRALYPPYPM